MRELWGLKNGERILHTAHRTTTSHTAWERLCMLQDKAKEETSKEELERRKRIGLENEGGNDIIKENDGKPEEDIKRQKSGSLKRGIKSYKKRIREHQDKINNPAKYIPEWESYDDRRKKGLKRHWEKEIKNFEKSLKDRIDELKNRGDYDE